jgi:hypothetical protein
MTTYTKLFGIWFALPSKRQLTALSYTLLVLGIFALNGAYDHTALINGVIH